jgi:hypothetical protein
MYKHAGAFTALLELLLIFPATGDVWPSRKKTIFILQQALEPNDADAHASGR